MSLMTGTHGAAAGADPITVIEAPGDAPRPAVLILRGRDGVRPAEVYRRYVDELAAGGVDAGLFSYYSPADACAFETTDARALRSPGVQAPDIMGPGKGITLVAPRQETLPDGEGTGPCSSLVPRSRRS